MARLLWMLFYIPLTLLSFSFLCSGRWGLRSEGRDGLAWYRYGIGAKLALCFWLRNSTRRMEGVGMRHSRLGVVRDGLALCHAEGFNGRWMKEMTNDHTRKAALAFACAF